MSDVKYGLSLEQHLAAFASIRLGLRTVGSIGSLDGLGNTENRLNFHCFDGTRQLLLVFVDCTHPIPDVEVPANSQCRRIHQRRNANLRETVWAVE